MRQHKVKSVYPGKLRIRYFLPYEKRTCSPQVVYYYWLSVSTSSPFSPSPGKNQSLSYHLWCFSTSGGLAISLCHSYTLDDPANHTAQHAWGLPSSPWEGKHWEATTTTPIEPISSQMKILQSCGLNTTVVSQQVRNVYKNLPSGPARGPPGAQEQMNTTRHNEPVRLQEAPSAMPVHLSEEGLCFGLAKRGRGDMHQGEQNSWATAETLREVQHRLRSPRLRPHLAVLGSYHRVGSACAAGNKYPTLHQQEEFEDCWGYHAEVHHAPTVQVPNVSFKHILVRCSCLSRHQRHLQKDWSIILLPLFEASCLPLSKQCKKPFVFTRSSKALWFNLVRMHLPERQRTVCSVSLFAWVEETGCLHSHLPDGAVPSASRPSLAVARLNAVREKRLTCNDRAAVFCLIVWLTVEYSCQRNCPLGNLPVHTF